MNSASVTDIFGTIVNNNRSRQVLLAGLIVFLTVLLFHNIILAPELKSIKQFSYSRESGWERFLSSI